MAITVSKAGDCVILKESINCHLCLCSALQQNFPGGDLKKKNSGLAGIRKKIKKHGLHLIAVDVAERVTSFMRNDITRAQ